MTRDSTRGRLDSNGLTGNRLAKPPPEEPDALIAHVRVCEGPGRRRPGLLGKRTACGIGIALVAVMSLAADTPEDIVNARIESSSASVRFIPNVYKMQAACTFSVNTMATRMKQPILKLIICYELGDGVRYFAEQYSATQEQKWSWGHGCKNGIEAASKLQTDVESSLLRRVTVKSNDLYIFPSVNKGAKVLAVRTELWFDGNMLCNDSPQNKFDLLKLALPEDWYVKGKYPDKIKYK